MRAHVGPDLRCAACGRPQRSVMLRSGDAWLTCWHQQCRAPLWAVVVPGAHPTAADVSDVLGDRLAASVLATFAPAAVVVIEVPATVQATLRTASRLVVVARLTQVLVGELAMKPAVPPREMAA